MNRHNGGNFLKKAVWLSWSYGRLFAGALLTDVSHCYPTSFKGALVAYFIFTISLEMLIVHHHCWKYTHFPMYRLFMYKGKYIMKTRSLKNNYQQEKIQIWLFWVFHPNAYSTMFLSFPSSLPPLTRVCCVCPAQ